MKTVFPEDDQNYQEKMIQELLKGKESATQLRILMLHDQSSAEEELAVKILTSFTQTLSMLTSSFSGSANQNISANDRCKKIVSLESTRSIKRLGPTERRGCYKRRNATGSRIQVSATMEVDGYAWRKYGQKDILNSEYPRCYYRCTHKYDQGCKATKQVQKIPQEDSSSIYQNTYFGHHTCNKLDTSSSKPSPEIISEIDPIDSCLFSFQSKPDTFSSTTIINPTAATSTQSDASAAHGSSCLRQQDHMIRSGSEIGGYYYHEEVVDSSFATRPDVMSFGVMDDDVVDFNKLGDLENGLYFDENDFL